MTAFCSHAITSEANLRADHGILRASALRVTSQARAAADEILRDARAEADRLTQDAQGEAQRLTQEAQDEAQRIAQNAQADAQRLTRDVQRQTLEQADRLLKGLEQAQETILLRAQDMVVELVQGMFDRLVMDTTPREKIEAVLRRVLQEAPPKLVSPVLRVHPDDAPLVPQVEWEIKPDAALGRGVCRLEATDGQWCADFQAAVEALRAAFVHATEIESTNPGPAGTEPQAEPSETESES